MVDASNGIPYQHPVLRRLSAPAKVRGAVHRLAASRSGGLPRHAGGAAHCQRGVLGSAPAGAALKGRVHFLSAMRRTSAKKLF